MSSLFSPANYFRGRSNADDTTDDTGTNNPNQDDPTQVAPATPTNRRVSSDASQSTEAERRRVQELLLDEEQARVDTARRRLEGTVAAEEDLVSQLSDAQRDTVLRRLLRSDLRRNPTSSSVPLAPPSPAFVNSSGEQLSALSSGLELRARRTGTELTSCVLVKKSDRGSDAVSRGKVMAQATATLSVKLNTFSATFDDEVLQLADFTSNTQEMKDRLNQRLTEYDMKSIVMMPSDFTDSNSLSNTSSFINLAKDWSVPEAKVQAWQTFINHHVGDVDLESVAWLTKLLTNSTDSELLSQATVKMEVAPKDCRGGVLLLNIIGNMILQKSHAMTTSLLNFLQHKNLADHRYDVLKYLKNIRCVLRALDRTVIPEDAAQWVLDNVFFDDAPKQWNAMLISFSGLASIAGQDTIMGSEDKILKIHAVLGALEKCFTDLRANNKWINVSSRQSPSALVSSSTDNLRVVETDQGLHILNVATGQRTSVENFSRMINCYYCGQQGHPVRSCSTKERDLASGKWNPTHRKGLRPSPEDVAKMNAAKAGRGSPNRQSTSPSSILKRAPPTGPKAHLASQDDQLETIKEKEEEAETEVDPDTEPGAFASLFAKHRDEEEDNFLIPDFQDTVN